MLPVTSSSSDAISSTSRSHLALIRDVVPETPRQAGVNSLIDAAAPIFSYLRALRQSSELPEMALLKKNLERKLKTFVEKIQHEVLVEDHVVLCHYALSATIDDVMQQLCTSASIPTTWRNERLLLAVEAAPETSMRFFVILEHLMESPRANLAVLELFYLCLTLGYLGPYRRSLRYAEYQASFDQLYKCIRTHRGKTVHLPKPLPSLLVQHTFSSIPWRFIVLSVGISLTLLFVLGYEWHASSDQFFAQF